jgi:AcrR family transcriptional regulator
MNLIEVNQINGIHLMGIRERRARERERRRQQIIVAAKRVFVNKGFGRATMDDIAKEAELSSGTLYLYFKNKDELYASMTLRVLQYLFIRLEHLHSEKELTSQEKIEQLKNALMDVYEFDPLILRNLFHLQSSEVFKHLSVELLREIRELGRKALDKMASIFQQGIREGICIDRQPAAMADIVWSLFSGIVLWETSKNAMDQNQNLLNQTLEMGFEILERGMLTQTE